MTKAAVEGKSQDVMDVYSIRTEAFLEEQRQGEREQQQNYEKNREAYEEPDRKFKEQARTMQSPQLDRRPQRFLMMAISYRR